MRPLLRPRSLLLAAPALLAFAHATPAAAETTWVETVVTDTTTPVDLTLDSTTVLCSSADYGALFLKVLIPDLARLTLLDHQNIGAGAPCVASGQCKPGNMPANIIVAGDPIERVDVNVKEVRLDEADSVAMTCNTTLIEKVQVTIRGIQFFHQRELPLGSRPFSDCATSASTGGGSGSGSGSDTGSGSDSGSGSVGSGSDDKSDDYGGADDPKTGGCDASTGSAGLTFGMIALGAALARRRRRA